MLGPAGEKDDRAKYLDEKTIPTATIDDLFDVLFPTFDEPNAEILPAIQGALFQRRSEILVKCLNEKAHILEKPGVFKVLECINNFQMQQLSQENDLFKKTLIEQFRYHEKSVTARWDAMWRDSNKSKYIEYVFAQYVLLEGLKEELPKPNVSLSQRMGNGLKSFVKAFTPWLGLILPCVAAILLLTEGGTNLNYAMGALCLLAGTALTACLCVPKMSDNSTRYIREGQNHMAGREGLSEIEWVIQQFKSRIEEKLEGLQSSRIAVSVQQADIEEEIKEENIENLTPRSSVSSPREGIELKQEEGSSPSSQNSEDGLLKTTGHGGLYRKQKNSEDSKITPDCHISPRSPKK